MLCSEKIYQVEGYKYLCLDNKQINKVYQKNDYNKKYNINNTKKITKVIIN